MITWTDRNISLHRVQENAVPHLSDQWPVTIKIAANHGDCRITPQRITAIVTSRLWAICPHSSMKAALWLVGEQQSSSLVGVAREDDTTDWKPLDKTLLCSLSSRSRSKFLAGDQICAVGQNLRCGTSQQVSSYRSSQQGQRQARK